MAPAYSDGMSISYLTQQAGQGRRSDEGRRTVSGIPAPGRLRRQATYSPGMQGCQSVQQRLTDPETGLQLGQQGSIARHGRERIGNARPMSSAFPTDLRRSTTPGDIWFGRGARALGQTRPFVAGFEDAIKYANDDCTVAKMSVRSKHNRSRLSCCDITRAANKSCIWSNHIYVFD